ncbi:MAG: hypothetical protein NVS3B12_26700 [Acidimicrobiales bacterium]
MPNLAMASTTGNSMFTNFVVSGTPGVTCPGADEFIGGEFGTVGHHAVWVGVSTDGGQTFTDHPVYVNRDPTADYGHQFVNVSLDRAGNAYALYSDNHNLFYSYSTDKGKTWSKPVQVNKGPSATAIMPWSVAGDAGKLVHPDDRLSRQPLRRGVRERHRLQREP